MSKLFLAAALLAGCTASADTWPATDVCLVFSQATCERLEACGHLPDDMDALDCTGRLSSACCGEVIRQTGTCAAPTSSTTEDVERCVRDTRLQRCDEIDSAVAVSCRGIAAPRR